MDAWNGWMGRAFATTFVAARFAASGVLAAAVAASGLAAGGCATKAELVAPRADISPYETAAGDALWAVAPPRNDTGTTAFDPQELGDRLVAASEEVRGLRCLPLNRTLSAMRSLGMESLAGPEDALDLIDALGVDGIVVPVVTAYDPYDPPKLGLSLALYMPRRPDLTSSLLNSPYRWQMQPTDQTIMPGSPFELQPVSTAGGLFDARNHDVLMRVQAFAAGRTETDEPHGWRVWLVDMDLYGEFVAHEAVSELLGREWVRLARESAAGVPG